MIWFFNWKGIVTSTPPIAGKALADIATNHSFSEESGKYILLDKIWKSSEESYNVSKQQALWNWTIDVLGKDDKQKRQFALI